MPGASPGILARGPWTPAQVGTSWRDAPYEPPPEMTSAADAAIHELRERGSPTHDGLAARLAAWEERADGLTLELQPARWALRLVPEAAAAQSLTALCVVRSEDGRWLAGRRAGWVATWANRWVLGAGGAVEVGESPVETLSRELEEEWRLRPSELSVEALLRLPNGLAMLVGVATVPADAEPVPDEEHDEFAWWPADPREWPADADERIRLMGSLLT